MDDKINNWSVSKEEGRIGTGNWSAFPHDRVKEIYRAAANWKVQLSTVELPWLCWNVNPEWCYQQQRLVRSVGWTPIVGTDGRSSLPKLLPEAILINFNEELELPAMWMHFPLEFAFLFAEKLAFWHSDVLMPESKLRIIANRFAKVQDGQTIADYPRVGLGYAIKRFRRGYPVFARRFFEVIGVTTAGASLSQYQNGTGWWRCVSKHPNATERLVKANPHYDHGFGIHFWKKFHGGSALPIDFNINPYHYCRTHPEYKQQDGGKGAELRASFDLNAIVSGLGLD